MGRGLNYSIQGTDGALCVCGCVCPWKGEARRACHLRDFVPLGMTFIWMKQGIEVGEVASPDLDANWVVFFPGALRIATALTLAILPKARTGLRNPDAVRGMWLGLILSAGYLSQNVGITTVTPRSPRS